MSPTAARRVAPIVAETAAGDEPVAVSLGAKTLHVKPVRKWRTSALRALREGDFEKWADGCLTDESVELWYELDPTIEEVEAFFTEWSEASGQDAGKSSALKRSSRATRTR